MGVVGGLPLASLRVPMRFLLVGLLLSASTALGQTLTLTVDNNTDPAEVIGLNRDDCGRSLSLRWTFNGTACEPLLLWVTTASSCRDEPGAGDYALDDVPANNVGTPGTRPIVVSSLPIFSGADGGTATTCATANVEQTMRVCGATRVQSIGTTCSSSPVVRVSTPPQVRFDTRAPARPAIAGVVPRDSALGVTVTAEDDSTVVVRAYPLLDGGVGAEAASDETTAGEGTAELTGLQNGVTYQVIAVATDQSENESEPSEPGEGTPVASKGLLQEYINANGQETGGCGATGGGIAGGAVLAALGFWLSRRKQS